MFIRVRDKRTKHEYDAPVDLVKLRPQNFVVLDKVPVSKPRPALHYVPEPDGIGSKKKSVGPTTETKE